jgi:hypothetical protein
MSESEKKEQLTRDERALSRRGYLAIAGGVVAVAVIGGAAYYLSQPAPSPTPTPTPGATPTPGPTPTPTPTPTVVKTVRYLGHPFWLPEDGVKEFERIHPNIKVEATYVDFYLVGEKQLADPSAWDLGGSGRYRPLVTRGIYAPIPAEKVPRWKEGHTVDTFIHADKYYGPEMAKRFNELLWVPGEEGKTLIAVPNMCGWESQNYLPEFLPYEENGDQTSMSFAELWNPDYKGHIALIDEGFDNFARFANYLDFHKQITFSGPLTNLTPDEVDMVYNFMLPIFKSGQIKSFWSKYGDIVAMMSTKEIWLSVSWVPVSLDCRKSGIPAYHAAIVEGPCFWYNCSVISKYGNPDVYWEALDLANFHLELTIQKLYAKMLYTSCAPYWDDLKDAMGKEFFEWFHDGVATYKPIDEIIKETWPDKEDFWTLPERLQKGLFLPEIYFKHFWTGEAPRTGTPHPRGKKRDLGSIAFKNKITRWFLSPDLPDYNDAYVAKWEELKASIPV